jgi:hypothetical protein
MSGLQPTDSQRASRSGDGTLAHARVLKCTLLLINSAVLKIPTRIADQSRVGLTLTAFVFVLFATVVLRPWLNRRLDGREMPRASRLGALGIVAVSGIVGSLVGHAFRSTVIGFVGFCAAMTVIGSVFVLRSSSASKN